jgi:hypothetical protein
MPLVCHQESTNLKPFAPPRRKHAKHLVNPAEMNQRNPEF